MIVVRMNGKELGGIGLVCAVDTSDSGVSMIDTMGDIKLADATGSISVNGNAVPEGYVCIDSARNRAQFSGADTPYMDLDLRKVHIDVDIFGDIDI